jgi:hypothetical protein
LAVFGLGIASAPVAAAPIGWNLCGGIYSSDASDDFFLGAGARLSAGTFTINPNAEYIFIDDGSSFSLNLDGLMNVLPLGAASGWLGGGLGLFMLDPDYADSDNETVINLIAGVGLNAVPLKPYGQIKYVLMDGDDPFVLALGVRF